MDTEEKVMDILEALPSRIRHLARDSDAMITFRLAFLERGPRLNYLIRFRHEVCMSSTNFRQQGRRDIPRRHQSRVANSCLARCVI